MDAEATSIKTLLDPTPTLAAQIAFDRPTLTVYASAQFAKDPMLVTWINRNKSRGINLKVNVTDLAEVNRLRDSGMRHSDRQTAGQGGDALEDALEILETAAYYRASDIHYLLRGKHADVLLTVNSDLRYFKEYRQSEAESLTRATWQGLVTTGDNQWKDMETQNAQVTGDKLKADTGVTSIRIVRGPMFPADQGGQFMVLRLQYSNTVSGKRKKDLPPLKFPPAPPGEFLLPKMGFTAQNIAKLKQLMAMPDGILIITGPTGSGKSTTDYELRKEEARVRPYLKQIVVADPIEFPEEWSTQISVVNALDQTATGLQYAAKLAGALRMAPNMITPGEIRGPEVALVAFEAATTGHKATTTLHVNDAFLWPDRLELMDQDRLHRKVFCDPKIIRGVVAQRLLRELCPDCSILASEHPESIEQSLLDILSTWANDGDVSKVRLRGPGCKTCEFDGSVGRFGIMEVVISDAQLMADFIHRGTAVARRNYHRRPDADPPLLQTAIEHVLAGRVDPHHVQEKVDIIVRKDKFNDVVEMRAASDEKIHRLEIAHG